MKFRVKLIPVRMDRSSVMMNQSDADELGLIVGDRVRVIYDRKSCIADVQIATGMIEKGEIGVCMGVTDEIDISEGTEVEVFPVPKPTSVEYIRKKMDGAKLTKEEIYSIVRDIVNNTLRNSGTDQIRITASSSLGSIGSVFDGNDIRNGNDRGVYLLNTKFVSIDGNTVINHTGGYAFYITSLYTQFNFTNNTIDKSTTGVYFQDLTSGNWGMIVENNTVHNSSGFAINLDTNAWGSQLSFQNNDIRNNDYGVLLFIWNNMAASHRHHARAERDMPPEHGGYCAAGANAGHQSVV
jgi:hypothetical protein